MNPIDKFTPREAYLFQGIAFDWGAKERRTSIITGISFAFIFAFFGILSFLAGAFPFGAPLIFLAIAVYFLCIATAAFFWKAEDKSMGLTARLFLAIPSVLLGILLLTETFLLKAPLLSLLAAILLFIAAASFLWNAVSTRMDTIIRWFAAFLAALFGIILLTATPLSEGTGFMAAIFLFLSALSFFWNARNKPMSKAVAFGARFSLSLFTAFLAIMTLLMAPPLEEAPHYHAFTAFCSFVAIDYFVRACFPKSRLGKFLKHPIVVGIAAALMLLLLSGVIENGWPPASKDVFYVIWVGFLFFNWFRQKAEAKKNLSDQP